jgi:hypothetical protein
VIEQLAEGIMIRGKVTCMGQMKGYEFNMPSMDFDDERGIEYKAAWLIEDATKA